jgi:hypothetical protein
VTYSIAGANGYGVVGTASGSSSRGVYGQTTNGGLGVVGGGLGANSRGVYGSSDGLCGASGDHTVAGTSGFLGTANEGVLGVGGGGSRSGVVGQASTGTTTAGVVGTSTANNGNGVIGESNNGSAAYGVWGKSNTGYGGVFSGPQYAIWAQGKAKVNVLEIVGGSDLAEPFDVNTDSGHTESVVEPGMVVVIDSANPGQLRISTQSYDRKVAGIISGANDLAPGMIMKAEGNSITEGAHPVALTGRVWCWCDAAIDAIAPGDMLTSSNTPGHAMRASDLSAAQGAVIGKAMTPLALGDRGLVLVLVNLQ